jgi:nicotinate-nucleotide pyrophosphorylase (carboxylating)
MNWEQFDDLLGKALEEDNAREDVTTRALIPPGLRVAGRVVARAGGIACGLDLAARLCRLFDPGITFTPCLQDGDAAQEGAELARLEGPARSVLAVERTMLNLLQRLSGIATLTGRFVEQTAGTRAAILDTRKTTPGWRALEKYAVRCGGGVNHRMSLGDMVLIKDNHVAIMSDGQPGPADIGKAVRLARDANPGLLIEVEVEDLAQLESAVEAGADLILLDNMTPDQVRQAVAMATEMSGDSRPQLEASGAINLANVKQYAVTGVDRISLGALTHSAPALDISLDITS